MGNTESAYDEDDSIHQPRSYTGGSMDYDHQPHSYAGSSTDYDHQPHSYAGSSTDYDHQPHPFPGSSMDPGHQPHSSTGSSISYGPPLPSYARSSTDHKFQHLMHPRRIGDSFSSLDQVISALREAGLESSNLILGIDFTKSNEWTGRYSFNRKSLHAISNIPNPYEQAISIIGRTLSPFDEDNLIPCFGFGDATTHDNCVFSFYPNQQYCHGFEEALARYREIVPHLKLSGPTSFAPIIDAAIDIVEASNRQYHVLVIIADGQVTRNPDTPPGSFSPQEKATIDSIVAASHHPLSIILVGVGDGPWDSMQQFDDNIPHRSFDNFQFVNFTKIMSENTDISKKEAAFALAALMEIPLQYKATLSLPPVNEDFVTGRRTTSLSPPDQVIDHNNAVKFVPPMPKPETVEPTAPAEPVCPICLTNPKDMAFGCGHTTCKDCSATLSTCPMCRQPITTRLRLFT